MRKYEDIVNVAVVNFRQVWGNTESNLARIKGFTKQAAKRGADIIVFPEMALTGYDNETDVPYAYKMQLRDAQTTDGDAIAEISAITKMYGVYAVFGMAERDKEKNDVVYNSVAVCGPKGFIGTYRKLHPALEEQCWCTRGNEPFMFDTQWGPVAVGICYDSYNFHELARYYAAAGARLYLNPTAVGGGPFFDWKEYYMTGLKQIVNSAEIFVASSNLTGFAKIDEEAGGSNDNQKSHGTRFGGGSIILGPGVGDKIHVYAGDVDSEEEKVFMETIDLSLATRRNFKVDSITGRPDYRPDLYIKLNQKLLETEFWKQFKE